MLKQKLLEKENKNYDENYERLKFSEGSFWMSNKINFIYKIFISYKSVKRNPNFG